MPLAQILGRFATIAAALLVVVGIAVVRLLSKNRSLTKDMRSGQLYLCAFILIELVRKLLPDDWSQLEKLTYIGGLILFSYGAIRAAAGGWFYFRRSRSGVETPKILRDLVDGGLFLLALFFIAQATLNVNLSALLASSAVISLVLGLALQETLGNLFAGLSLQAERTLAEGDWVRIGAHSGPRVS